MNHTDSGGRRFFGGELRRHGTACVSVQIVRGSAATDRFAWRSRVGSRASEEVEDHARRDVPALQPLEDHHTIERPAANPLDHGGPHVHVRATQLARYGRAQHLSWLAWEPDGNSRGHRVARRGRPAPGKRYLRPRSKTTAKLEDWVTRMAKTMEPPKVFTKAEESPSTDLPSRSCRWSARRVPLACAGAPAGCGCRRAIVRAPAGASLSARGDQ